MLTLTSFLVLLLLGAAAATFGSILGLGGGIILVPALIFLGPVLIGEEIGNQLAVGTSLAVLILTALSSALSYMKQKKVDFRAGWLFFASSGPGAILGASLTRLFQPHQFQLAFGGFMLLMAGLLIARQYMKPVRIDWRRTWRHTDSSGSEWVYGYHPGPALLVGFFVGLSSGLFGIGGGALLVPMMVLLFGYPPHLATATSMFVILFSAILGSVTHVIHGNVDWLLLLALAPGAWVGGWFGAWIARRMSSQLLLWLLRSTMLLFAFKMIYEGLQ